MRWMPGRTAFAWKWRRAGGGWGRFTATVVPAPGSAWTCIVPWTWATRARMESEAILARVRQLGDTTIERLEVVVKRP